MIFMVLLFSSYVLSQGVKWHWVGAAPPELRGCEGMFVLRAGTRRARKGSAFSAEGKATAKVREIGPGLWTDPPDTYAGCGRVDLLVGAIFHNPHATRNSTCVTMNVLKTHCPSIEKFQRKTD